MDQVSKDRIRGSRTAVSTTSRREASDEAAEARRKLEALFSNGNGGPSSAPSPSGASPPRSRAPARVFASPRKSTGRIPSEYRLRLERLRIAREPDDIREAADVFLKHHQLPDDVDVLYKVLQHPEEKVVRDALGQISSLLIQGRLQRTMLLEEHLKDLTCRVQEEATMSYLDGVRGQLATLKEKEK